MRVPNILKPLWLLGLSLLIVSCGPVAVSKFKVQRPAKLNIDRDIKKIFIDPAMIKDSNDKLKVKNSVILKLRDTLNSFKRFQVAIGPVEGVDPNRETIAVLQGEIISGGEVSNGQFTEIATCTGGIGGFAGGIAATKSTKQGVTFSRRGLLCHTRNLTSSLVSSGVTSVLALAGIKQNKPAIDEVVRIYKYKNISFFTQINLNITKIGQTRESITIRSDIASFGRHIVEPARNVHETYMSIFEAAPLLISPVTPLFIRRFAIVDASNPDTIRGSFYKYWTPQAENIPQSERKKIIDKLINRALMPFIKTISPYREMAEIEIDEAGNKRAVQLLKTGKWVKARQLLEKLPDKSLSDNYNYALTFEAGAETVEDYEEAKRIYLAVLTEDPSSKLYAQGVGRMERRLGEAKTLKTQTGK